MMKDSTQPNDNHQRDELERQARRTDWALIVAIVSLIVSVVSVLVSGYIGVRQLTIDQTQLTLMNKQDEMLDRRAELHLSLRPGALNGGYAVVVTNKGRRAARDFEFVVRTDASRLRGTGLGGAVRATCERMADGSVLYVVSGTWSTPLYPERSVETDVSFGFWAAAEPARVEWQAVSEDGVFPDRGAISKGDGVSGFGVLSVPVTGETRPAGVPKIVCP